MFIVGLFLMTISIAGLVALAFVQARYPQALDSMLLPPEQRKAQTEAEAAIQLAMAPVQTEDAAEAEIDLGKFVVNSMASPQQMPVPPSE